MSTAIGYVETIREDLLEAAWRSTISTSLRAPRRRPSMRWIVAGATALTLVASGFIGWTILLPNGVSSIRAENAGLRTSFQPSERAPSAMASPSAVPAPAAGGQTGDDTLGVAQHAASDQSVSAEWAAAGPEANLGTIHPVGDLSRVVKTASLAIVVGHDTFGARFTGIGDIADRLGGYISSSSTSGGKSGYATMRVPAGRFQDALRSLRGLGRVDSEDIRGKDVTAQYVDLTARLRIALARRRVLFGLMQKAVSIEQTIRVQNALDDVQLRIEELQGEINVLDDRVSEATIRVSMREAGVRFRTGANVENPNIGSAIDHAIAGFFSVIAGVIVGLGWIIPALAVLALLWFLVARVRRRLA